MDVTARERDVSWHIARAQMLTPKTSRRDAIFVLGMGRSGTSMIAKILALCGAALPRRLERENEWNERGYWEPAAAIRLNDDFLAERASSWWDPWPAEHEADVSDPVSRRFVDAIVELLKAEYPTEGTIVVKEPRIAGLIPYWFDAARRAGYRVKVVHIVRHPDEVAKSLLKRDAATRRLSQQLWLKYNLATLVNSRNVPQILISYDELITAWKNTVEHCIALMDLDLAVGERSREAIDAFISPGLRHHRSDSSIENDLTEGRLLTQTYDEIMASLGTRADHQQFMRLEAQYRSMLGSIRALPDGDTLACMPLTDRIVGAADNISVGGQAMPLHTTLVIGPSFSFQVHGWALRTDGYIAVDDLILTQDGCPVASATWQHRPDITALYGQQAGLSGFDVLLKGYAADGPHHFELYAVADEKRRCLGHFDVRVVASMSFAETPLLHVNETVETSADDRKGTVACSIRGWGLDPKTAKPLAGAALLVDDDLIIPCSYGSKRPDIQEIFDATDDGFGFTSIVRSIAVATGVHRVRAIGVPASPHEPLLVSARSITVRIGS